MKSTNSTKLLVALLVFTVGLVIATIAGDTVKVEGLIQSRSGEMMILKTATGDELTIILSDSTSVSQVQGLLKARRKEKAPAALIPGLAVKVEGTYNEKKQLEAKSVTFKGNDLEQAEAIEAGMHETKVQAKQNTAELAKQNAELQAQNTALQAQQKQLAENKTAIDAAVARFGQLDDYYIFDEVTVYFANGKITVDPKYTPQLLALAEKAKPINGYMIEVKGYASAVGSKALNQKLSEDRADNVSNILLQQGNVPLTRMLAPGAMGESNQVGDDQTEQGQAENRRVVVRVLQNKAIAGVNP